MIIYIVFIAYFTINTHLESFFHERELLLENIYQMSSSLSDFLEILKNEPDITNIHEFSNVLKKAFHEIKNKFGCIPTEMNSLDEIFDNIDQIIKRKSHRIIDPFYFSSYNTILKCHHAKKSPKSKYKVVASYNILCPYIENIPINYNKKDIKKHLLKLRRNFGCLSLEHTTDVLPYVKAMLFNTGFQYEKIMKILSCKYDIKKIKLLKAQLEYIKVTILRCPNKSFFVSKYMDEYQTLSLDSIN